MRLALSAAVCAMLLPADARAESDPYACSLLSDEESARTLGSGSAAHRVVALSEPSNGASECFFNPVGGNQSPVPQLSVRFEPNVDSATARASFQAQLSTMQDQGQQLDKVKDLGDDAVAYTLGTLNISVILKGRNVLTVGGTSVARDPVLDAAFLAVERLKD